MPKTLCYMEASDPFDQEGGSQASDCHYMPKPTDSSIWLDFHQARLKMFTLEDAVP